MPVGHTGAKAPSPWFTAQSPWPWFTGLTRKGSTGIGNPQAALSPGAERFGFNVDVSFNLSSNASGSTPTALPPTVDNVINLFAAQIASAPAFSRRASYDY